MNRTKHEIYFTLDEVVASRLPDEFKVKHEIVESCAATTNTLVYLNLLSSIEIEPCSISISESINCLFSSDCRFCFLENHVKMILPTSSCRVANTNSFR